MLVPPPLQLALAALLHLTLSTSNVSASTSLPDYQLLNVSQALFGTSQASEFYHEELVNVTESDDRWEWKLKLVHRDWLSFNKTAVFMNHNHRFHARMQRDVKRVASLLLRISGGGIHYGEATDGVNDFESDVVSGMDQGSGEYFVRIGVGSPPRSQYMVIDSGSDIVWVQCQPCNQCYKQADPVFDPAASASYGGVSCSSSVCDRIENSGCHGGRCRYEVMYGDGSYTKGTLALESLTFAGLLGLGGGSMSLVDQLGGQTGGAFSYCLVSRATNSSGSLVFGREAMPVGAAWVPLLRNPLSPTFYYIGLSGLGVGGIRVPISEDIFQLTELGYGGVVMDTGTAVTRFPVIAYNTFRDAFTEQTANLPRVSGVSIFDTCYNLSSFITVRIPTISFYLSSGPILTLPANNFLIPVDDAGTFCFAFASSDSDLSIIGNIQQEGIQISFDGANGYVGFGPNVC
ncbi:Protein ASPARTIC PROTEASE IN GUARD CELL 2 [Hibiscus syriacus]|uniref:Protein ASPARTIC PROTEASE IN GUARD CELL 2 n=1 Tax=Hibiscus syriacus TaxID=106335 RepID=A0A6A2Z4D7_HIBSY|nr:Protein ASPARTIC PROTEASE IN GUARD CELL 2 [Hibiscus syriacus]